MVLQSPGWTLRGRERRRKGFHERVRRMILRHLDEIPVEGSEQLPVLRLVGRAGFPAAGGAFEAGSSSAGSSRSRNSTNAVRVAFAAATS
jgi:hypothetical protein